METSRLTLASLARSPSPVGEPGTLLRRTWELSRELRRDGHMGGPTYALLLALRERR